MSDDIYRIVERLAILEGRITPTTIKHGLNPQQKSVPQLPALFKPKHISVLGSKKDPEHPMHDYAVGASESEESEEEMLDEAKVDEEKLLNKVKKSLADYLAAAKDKYHDQDLKDRVKVDRDLGKKDLTDHDLIAKAINEDPTEEEPGQQAGTVPDINPTYAECYTPVKSITLEDGRVCEIHGDAHTGFEIRHGNRSLKSKFRSLKEANMAIEMFRARQRKQDESQDYVEEK